MEEELGITYDQVQKDAIIKFYKAVLIPGQVVPEQVINGTIKTYADLMYLDFKV